MECAVTNALNKFEDRQERKDKQFDLFLKSIDTDLVEISDSIERIRNKAKWNDEFNFEEDIKELVMELI